MSYDKMRERSVTIAELNIVSDWVRALEDIDYAYLLDGSVTITDISDNKCAEIWWDSDAETWRVDWIKNG